MSSTPGERLARSETTSLELDQRGRILLRIAWEAAALAARRPIPIDREARRHAFLRERGAVFVSLHRPLAEGGLRLRGCLGTLEPIRPLLEDIRSNAAAVVHRDPRFSPVSGDELEELELEVTELEPLRPIAPANRAELLACLRPGVDGLLVRDGPHRATFLPQVWERGRVSAEEFVSALFRKAGLPDAHWSSDLELFTYGTRAWSSRWPEKPRNRPVTQRP